MAQTLLDLKNQTENIKIDKIYDIKQEIRKLILLYQDFVKGTHMVKSYKGSKEQLAKTCLILSGDTRYSINSNSFFRETIFN